MDDGSKYDHPKPELEALQKGVLEGWDIYTQHESDKKLNRDVLSSTGIAI